MQNRQDWQEAFGTRNVEQLLGDIPELLVPYHPFPGYDYKTELMESVSDKDSIKINPSGVNWADKTLALLKSLELKIVKTSAAMGYSCQSEIGCVGGYHLYGVVDDTILFGTDDISNKFYVVEYRVFYQGDWSPSSEVTILAPKGLEPYYKIRLALLEIFSV